MRRPRLAACVLAAALLAACGDDTATTNGADHMNADAGSDAMGGMGGMVHDDASQSDNSPVVEGARRIEVVARSFAFSPAEITVGAGEDIAIVLTSDDVLHDLTIEELDVHVVAAAGDTGEGGLRADEPGRYAFFCTVAGHRAAGMEGTLVVE